MRGCTKCQLQHQGLQQGLRLSQHEEFSMWLCLPRHVQKTSQCAFNCCVWFFSPTSFTSALLLKQQWCFFRFPVTHLWREPVLSALQQTSPQCISVERNTTVQQKLSIWPKTRVGKSLSAEQLTKNTDPAMLLSLFFFFFSPFSLSRTIKPLLAGYYIFNM